jgi:hypothetical protein
LATSRQTQTPPEQERPHTPPLPPEWHFASAPQLEQFGRASLGELVVAATSAVNPAAKTNAVMMDLIWQR